MWTTQSLAAACQHEGMLIEASRFTARAMQRQANQCLKCSRLTRSQAMEQCSLQLAIVWQTSHLTISPCSRVIVTRTSGSCRN